ncbi:MAG: rRNA pseudouridine synthase [Bacteroidales bacterium]|nr:rRNA pseudouridine synthase [Bacteroidales bacterium]
MNNEERDGRRQHVARKKTAEVRRFSDERLEQFEREKSRREGDDFADDRRSERRPSGERRSFGRRDDDRGGRRPFGRRDDERDERRGFGRRDDERDERRGFGRRDDDRDERRGFGRRDDERGERRGFGRRDDERGERRGFGRRDDERGERRGFGRRDDERDERRGFGRRDDERDERRPFGRRDDERGGRRPFGRRDDDRRGGRFDRDDDRRGGRKGYRREKDPEFDRPKATGEIRLNKYLADSGVCSRREADDLILAGAVSVNGEVVTELGTKVQTTDKVVYGGQTLNREKLRYVLLNKPKGVITTSDDPYERHTVMELVEGACEERIYPVGRLDRNTLGLLLLTNDGDLAKVLTHPSHEVEKLYHVRLNKPLAEEDFEKIQHGIELEDGPIKVDRIDYVVEDPTMCEVGVQIHSGRNHIVRRIFESLGYEIMMLDRVMLAGLTKKKLERGHWRFLTDLEVSMLKRIESRGNAE